MFHFVFMQILAVTQECVLGLCCSFSVFARVVALDMELEQTVSVKAHYLLLLEFILNLPSFTCLQMKTHL